MLSKDELVKTLMDRINWDEIESLCNAQGIFMDKPYLMVSTEGRIGTVYEMLTDPKTELKPCWIGGPGDINVIGFKDTTNEIFIHTIYTPLSAVYVGLSEVIEIREITEEEEEEEPLLRIARI